MPIPLLLTLAIATPVQATPACAVPADLSGWTAMTPLTAGETVRTAPPLTIGHGARATLETTTRLHYARPPEKAAAPATFGGLFAITIARAGRYRIALGEGAWIDVLAGDRPVASVAHSHGPACTQIRKMVDFDLTPGRYLVQVAGSQKATLPLLVAAVTR